MVDSAWRCSSQARRAQSPQIAQALGWTSPQFDRTRGVTERARIVSSLSVIVGSAFAFSSRKSRSCLAKGLLSEDCLRGTLVSSAEQRMAHWRRHPPRPNHPPTITGTIALATSRPGRNCISSHQPYSGPHRHGRLGLMVSMENLTNTRSTALNAKSPNTKSRALSR
jgi:hypothetical protein